MASGTSNLMALNYDEADAICKPHAFAYIWCFCQSCELKFEVWYAQAISSSWPMSVSAPSHVFAPSLRTSCNFCSRLPLGDTSPQTVGCLADATLPEASLSWAKRVSLVKESTKRWHLPSHAEHELCKVCICTSHLELVGLKKMLANNLQTWHLIQIEGILCVRFLHSACKTKGSSSRVVKVPLTTPWLKDPKLMWLLRLIKQYL